MSMVQLFFSTVVLLLAESYIAEKATYLNIQRPQITFFSSKYFRYFNTSCSRYRRSNVMHYCETHMDMLYPINFNITANIEFHEFLSNQYKRSFVEMHLPLCDVIDKDTFFGDILKQGRLKKGCPVAAGRTDFYNMSIPPRNVPDNFPFQKGRIFINLRSTDTNKDFIFSGYIDMEIKRFTFKEKING